MVLSQIVPGLTISMYNFGPQVLKNGNIGCRVQLMSKKNSKEIPLRYESEGIKKIVSILQLLIVDDERLREGGLADEPSSL